MNSFHKWCTCPPVFNYPFFFLFGTGKDFLWDRSSIHTAPTKNGYRILILFPSQMPSCFSAFFHSYYLIVFLATIFYNRKMTLSHWHTMWQINYRIVCSITFHKNKTKSHQYLFEWRIGTTNYSGFPWSL